MKALWNKIVNAIRRLFGGKQRFAVVWAGMTNETNGKLNNGQLQELAWDAVRTAAEAGLKGGEARAEAVRRCKDALAAIGVELADRLIDTLVQIGYAQFRDTEG
jgi:hypothetical protein